MHSPLQAVLVLPGEPGLGRMDAPAGSWVGMWRAFFCISALSVKFPRGSGGGRIVPKIHAEKRLLDESAAARPCESQGCLRRHLSPHLDTC